MIVSSEFTKALASTGVVCACCAGGIYAYNNDLFDEIADSSIIRGVWKKSPKGRSGLPLTKFDKALITHLEQEDGDISFRNGNYQMPNGLRTGDSSYLKLRVKIGADLREKDYFRDLNGGEDWTWSCKFRFFYIAGGGNNLSFSVDAKNSIREFLKILKEDGNKDKKIKFVEECAIQRKNQNGEIERLNKLSDAKPELKFLAKENELTNHEEIIFLERRNRSDNKLYFKRENQLEELLEVE